MKISIVVPVYKVPERYLRQCLDSCTNQTLKEIEVIVVHDVADDQCGEICDEYQRKYDCLKVIHKNGKVNGGLSAARNDGVKAATGDWITFVDGDDFLEADACEAMYNTVNKYSDVDILITSEYKDYDGNLIPYRYKYSDGQIFEKEECMILQRDVLDFNSFISGVYAKLMRRSFLINNNILHDEELKCGVEGLEYSIRMYGIATKVVFSNKYTYHYLYNDNSLSASPSEAANTMVLLGFKKIEHEIAKYNDTILWDNFYSRILHAIITTAISGYFNPIKNLPYKERKESYEKYLKNELCVRAIEYNCVKSLSLAKRITLFFIKTKNYMVLYLIAKCRAKQLQHRKKVTTQNGRIPKNSFEYFD